MGKDGIFDEIIDRRDSPSIKWTRYGRDVLPLWVADMDFRAPLAILEALRGAVDHGVFGYENPRPSLRRLVAARMESLYGWAVDPDWVVAVTGIVSGFYAAARALCLPGKGSAGGSAPGRGYLIQTPVYMPFNDLERHLGLVRQEAALARVDRDGAITYDINWDVFSGAFGSRGERTSMFLLCSPHNPLGLVWDEATLRRMAGIALDRGAAIVSDEIHAELLLGGARHRPVASLDRAIEARSITLVAPSKTFNTAGLYCGFAIVPDPALRAAYEGTVERLTLHPSSLALVAAEAAYSGACDDWLRELLAYLAANRDFTQAFLARRIPRLGMTRPEATYLAWIDGRGLGVESPYRFFLEKAKVALNDGATFGSGGAGYVRLNFACPRATLEEGLERMARAVDSL